jgi:hypothetical protein
MSKEVMQQALEALVLNNAEWKSLADSGDSGYWKAEDQDHYQQTNKAITALETELAKPDFWEGYVPEPVKPAQQEPVAYLVDGDLYYPEEIDWETLQEQGHTVASLYTQAQRTWVSLTDEEITDIWAEASPYYHEDDFARAIEAKLKEKNT